MAHSPEDDALASEHLAGSEENLLTPATPPRGTSNSKALKIAGLTTLACMLVASQIFAGYMVFDQRQQIHGLQKTSDRLSRDMHRLSQAKPPMKKLQMPMNSLLMDFSTDQDAVATKPPQPKQQDTANLEKQLRNVMQHLNLPRFNETFLDNMQSLKQQMNETEWESFETWMRHWLILQRSQQKPAPPQPQPTASVIKTKCQIEATGGVGRFGSFKPRCDEEGHYHHTQCWEGFCWCVDETGATIQGTVSRKRPECGALSSTAAPDVSPDTFIADDY